jgi:hypothetical protein
MIPVNYSLAGRTVAFCTSLVGLLPSSPAERRRWTSTTQPGLGNEACLSKGAAGHDDQVAP